MARHRATVGPIALIAYIFACAGVLASPSRAPADAPKPPRPPNVVLLVADDQRPDTIAALGNDRIRTPNLDRLARGGVSFTRAIAAYPHCGPSRTEIAFGRCYYSVDKRNTRRFPTWAETMNRAGYLTWYVGKWDGAGSAKTCGFQETRAYFTRRGDELPPEQRKLNVPRDWKGRKVTAFYDRVFEDNEGRILAEKGVGLTPTISEDFADAAVELIERKPERPFFLQVGFTAPHDPLLMPPGYEGMYRAEQMQLPTNFRPKHPFEHPNSASRDETILLPSPRAAEDIRREWAMYYTVISHLDAQIGRILDALSATGQSENTLVIFTSDQGLALGSHGLVGKDNMYEHTVGVPLIVAGPGMPADRRCEAQCYLRDLFPTVCDYAGLKIPESVQGRSLMPVLRGRREEIYPFVIGYCKARQRMIRTEEWKLTYYPALDRYQLFNLADDPHELHDLADDPAQSSRLARLHERLRRRMQELTRHDSE